MTISFITCMNNSEHDRDLDLWRHLNSRPGYMVDWEPAENFLNCSKEQQEKWTDAEDLISYQYPVPLTTHLQHLLNAAPCVREWDEV